MAVSSKFAAQNTSARKAADKAFAVVCFLAATSAIVFLVLLFAGIVKDGMGSLSLDFLKNPPSRFPSKAGVFTPLMGTVWVIGLTAAIAVPVGVAAAVYLEEFANRRSWATRLINLNISNLAGVPSIVYGLLGLAIFVRYMDLGRSVLAASLTMALLILPMVVVVTQEAIKAVPYALREGSLALGATRWQTVRKQILPAAMPGILTGIILSLSRAIGETAPLIVVGAFSYIKNAPEGVMDKFTVMPYQVFYWTSQPKESFHQIAAGAILVLMATLVLFNAAAIVVRVRSERRK